jgi:ABC-type uncharacterized transport system YnjBCD ATPase subunit
MVMQEEVNRTDARHLKPVNWSTSVLIRPEQFLDFIYSQERAQPIPFVVVSYEETDVAVTGLVAALLSS